MANTNVHYLLVTSLPGSGHQMFTVGDEAFSIDRMNNNQWFVHSGSTPIATVHGTDGAWEVCGANDYDAATVHKALPSALKAASKRY